MTLQSATDKNLCILETGTLSGRICRACKGSIRLACCSNNCSANSRSAWAVFGESTRPGRVNWQLFGSRISFMSDAYTYIQHSICQMSTVKLNRNKIIAYHISNLHFGFLAVLCRTLSYNIFQLFPRHPGLLRRC